MAEDWEGIKGRFQNIKWDQDFFLGRGGGVKTEQKGRTVFFK